MHFRALCKVLPLAERFTKTPRASGSNHQDGLNKGTIKIPWLVMKLTTILLLATLIQARASGYSQEVTLSEKNAPLEKIFNQIRNQTGYEFFYNNGMLATAKKVDVSVKGASIKDVLDLCFSQQPLSYTIYDKTIIVNARPLNLSRISGAPYAKIIDVLGQVTDDKGEVVAGATITVKGTSHSTSTDDNGNFILRRVEEDATLVISGVNFDTYQVAVNGKTSINVKVTTAIKEMNEAVVIGFGTQKKINLTGAVSQVSGEELVDRPVSNLGQALQGVVPNLNLTTAGDPGGPGTNSSFNIRGNTSTAPGGNSSPLFIVDGVPVDNINDINPPDIENISVLKDAAASSIYGARAPYGVILVTTKKGKKGEKALVSYSNMFGQSSYTTLPRMANSLEFANAFNIASINSGQGAPFSDDILMKIKTNIEKPGSYPVSEPDPNNPGRWTYASPLNTDNVDWFRAYFKPWSFNQKHDLSVSGGSVNTTYYLGLGYYDQGGQLRYANEEFKRYNLTGNLHTEPTKWLRIDLKTRFSKRKIDIPFDYANQMGNWVHMITTRQPNWALRDPDGNFSLSGNLEFTQSGGRRKTNEDDLTLIGSFEMEPVKNWKINMDYSYNNQVFRSQFHNAYVYSHGTDGSIFNIGPSVNSVGEGSITDNYQSTNLYTSYDRKFGGHYLKLLVGQQMEVYNGYNINGERSDLITDDIPAINVATGTQNVYDAILHWATMGTFARFNYNYEDKYMLEIDGRYDGSSRFPSGSRYGFFPSFSAGYNLARENYWAKLRTIINEFKIRGSYGALGNQNVYDYLYLATVPINSNLPYIINGIRPNYLGAPPLISPDLTWEKSRTIDFGLDAAFLNNRLGLTFDWYTRRTLDMLGPSSVLPATLGAGVPFQNNADLTTRGIELTLTWRDRLSKDFTYNVSFVLGDYQSTIERYYNTTNLLSNYYPGQKLGEIWGYETAGLIQSQRDIDQMPDQSFIFGRWTMGDVLYKDLNGDGAVNIGKNTLDDHGDLKVIGNNTPRFNFGLNLGASWKAFDFTMFWQGVAKRDAWLSPNEGNNSGNIFWGFVPNFGNNVYKTTLDFWTPENTDAYWPAPYLSSEIAKNHKVQSRYLQNAAYARLKNIQLGYDLSARVLRGRGIKKLRIFVSGENLITITKLNKNFDPEAITGGWGAGKIYPLLKTVSAGLNLTF